MPSRYPTQQTQTPESLVSPAEVLAANRRLLAAITTANGLPTLATDGVACTQWNQLAIELQCLIGTSVTCSVYWYYAASGLWAIDTSIGLQTVAKLDTNTDATATILIQNTRAASRVYVRAFTFTAGTETLSAWIESNQ